MSGNQQATSEARARKKFLAPPVKSACLACRSARIRCDGKEPCAHCEQKLQACLYKPSRRGGPRRKKVLSTSGTPEKPNGISQDVGLVPLEVASSTLSQALPVPNFIDPGAGLAHPEYAWSESDVIFDALFAGPNQELIDGTSHQGDQGLQTCIVRAYSDHEAILDAYYVFIHIYFPILPPPTTPPVDQLLHDPYSPSPDRHAVALSDSPLVLAILALLSLIPHPLDSDPLSYTSTLARRARAQKMADAAFRLVDDEEDIAESENEPAKALSEGHLVRSRKAFHPLVPQALEAIIALDLLSVYEYAQRGNLKKMQSRSGQALMACMSQGLNTCSLEDDFTEARRRVWWMTYISVIQAAVVNNQSSSPSMIDPSHSVPLPTLASDTQVFHIFLQAQRAIYKATEFVTSQNKAAREQVQTFKLTQDMMDLDAHLSLLVQQCESLASQAGSTLCLTPDEAVVAWSLRCISRIKLNSARIKLHRYRAFQDVPIFPVRHCDLTKTEDSDSPSNGNDSAHGCCGLTGYEPIEAISTSVPWVRHDSVLSHPRSEHHLQIPGNHESAKMCLRSALAIASAFDDLPYPNPTGATDPSSPTCFLSSHSDDICPRTMPSFACCAMQCAYVLLMTHRKTKQLYPHAVAKWNRSAESRTIVDDVTASQANKAIVTGNPSLDELLRKLSIGFYSISWTLSNYASTCEAIGGMRDLTDQVRSAIAEASTFC